MSELLVGEHLFRRLKEIGIDTVFGVPGDYELALLDLIPSEGLTWSGSPNELVGAYSADGYARVKGAGALVTTFGPGELSAICGIGGSFTELVPIVHIVGFPSTEYQKSGKIFHHTLGDLKYDHYAKMSAEISCAATILNDPATACAEIDRCLNAMLYYSKPVYIAIPPDVAYTKVSSQALNTPLVRDLLPNEPKKETAALDHIIKRIEAAKFPTMVVDGGAGRHSVQQYATALMEELKIPTYCTVLSKGMLLEDSPYFCGTYAGSLGSGPGIIDDIDKSDCILWLGRYSSDFNTGMFSENMAPNAIIECQRFYIEDRDKGIRFDVKMNHVLQALLKRLQAGQVAMTQTTPLTPNKQASPSTQNAITHEWLWPRLTPFIKPGDITIIETGTAQMGISHTYFPKNTTMFTQAIYGSIGYASGAAIGASVAAKETGQYKRLVLVTGDGSLQLTIQAFSILLREGIVPVIFVLNNNGYTIERYIHGVEAKYNDIPMWDYGALFKAFGPDISTIKTFKTNTAADMDALLDDPSFQNATYPQLVDVSLGIMDGPGSLKAVFAHDKVSGGL